MTYARSVKEGIHLQRPLVGIPSGDFIYFYQVRSETKVFGFLDYLTLGSSK